MKSALAIISFACLSARATDVTFAWDPQPQADAFRFYDVAGTNLVLLGSVSTNRFTVANWDKMQPRTVTVTASNLWGEGPAAVPLTVPAMPNAPQHITIQVGSGGTASATMFMERSPDLLSWDEIASLTATNIDTSESVFLRGRLVAK